MDGAARIRTGYAQSKAKRQRGVSLQVGTTDPTPGRKKEIEREGERESEFLKGCRGDGVRSCFGRGVQAHLGEREYRSTP